MGRTDQSLTLPTPTPTALKDLIRKDDEEVQRAQRKADDRRLIAVILERQGPEFLRETIRVLGVAETVENLTAAERVVMFLESQPHPVEPSLIAEATGVSQSAIRGVLYSETHGQMFEQHPHPDHSTRRRWSLKADHRENRDADGETTP